MKLSDAKMYFLPRLDPQKTETTKNHRADLFTNNLKSSAFQSCISSMREMYISAFSEDV